jgi:hypothetical protein
MATGIDVGHKIIDGAQWVDRVEISPSGWTELGTSKPGRFTVSVHTNDDWPSAGKGAEIVVRLSVGKDAQATFSVKNQCKPTQPGKPEKLKTPKPGKRDKAEKPDKPKKPKKNKGAHLYGDPSFWALYLAHLEV